MPRAIAFKSTYVVLAVNPRARFLRSRREVVCSAEASLDDPVAVPAAPEAEVDAWGTMSMVILILIY
jgi:hypothetical protein